MSEIALATELRDAPQHDVQARHRVYRHRGWGPRPPPSRGRGHGRADHPVRQASDPLGTLLLRGGNPALVPRRPPEPRGLRPVPDHLHLAGADRPILAAAGNDVDRSRGTCACGVIISYGFFREPGPWSPGTLRSS